MSSKTVTAFIDCIDELSYTRKKDYSIGIQDIVVWTGAGFSKSWNDQFPSGVDLFAFGTLESISSDSFPNIKQYVQSVVGWPQKKEIDFSFIKMISYRLSLQRAYPELQNRYMDRQLAEKIQNELSLWLFQKMRPLLEDKIDTCAKGNIHRFLDYLSKQSTDTNEGGTGFRLNFISTNYDFCIESALGLAPYEKEIFLYRGFSPVQYNGCSFNNVQIEDNPHNSLLKLNGGLEIIEKNGKYSVEYCLETLASYYADIHKNKILILPNNEQDYSSQYFRMIFPKAVELLRKARLLLFIGTSLPEEDVLFKHLLSHFAEQKADYFKKYVFLISKTSTSETQKLRQKIIAIFPQYAHILDHLFLYSNGVNSFIDEFAIQNAVKYPRESIWNEWCAK
jgi:hypothetical protein